MIYLWFLCIVFFISIFFSVISSAKDFLGTLHIPSLFYQSPKNIQDLQKDMQQFIQEMSPVLNQAEEVLPPNQYSYQADVLFALKRVLSNIQLISPDLPKFEMAFQEGIHTASLSSFVSLLHKDEKVLTEMASDIVFLFDHVKNIPLLSDRLKPYEVLISESYPLIQHFPEFLDAFYTITGDTQPHHMVILLQNSNEKRSTGGFIGSFADIFFNDGKIVSFKIEDIYRYDGQMQGVTPVPELVKTLVGNHAWSLRDSNYHPIFSKSAESFMSMYEQAGGETIDTVIAIDQTFIEDALNMIGGIDLPEYGIHLDGKNFSFVLSYIVEGKFSGMNPKSFISERLFPLLQEAFLKNIHGENLLELYRKQKKSLQIFSQESSINRAKNFLGIAQDREALLKDNSTLFLNEISISGNKSDAFVSKEIHLDRHQKNTEGEFTLSIDRSHHWGAEQENSYLYLKKHIGEPKIPKNEHENILGKGSNHTIFQLFLPKTAHDIQCKNTESFRTFDFDGKTVLEFISPLLFPGQKQTLSCSFRLALSFGGMNLFDSQEK